MLTSYFFIPANNKKFIKKRDSLNCDYIVFDFEDAILEKEYLNSINNISDIEILEAYYARLSFFDDKNNFNANKFEDLLKMGFKNFLIPKFSNEQQLEIIANKLNKFDRNKNKYSFILLIEHPRGLFELISSIKHNILPINGIGFGSHDYCNIMGMKHTLENLSFARHFILNIAKAYSLKAIDIVSTELSNMSSFEKECINGFNLGFDGKFLIHPKQLDTLNNIQYYSKEEIDEAEKIYEKILGIKENKISIISIDGKVYEKPHIQHIINIINWRNHYGNK